LCIQVFFAGGLDLLEFNRAVECEGHALEEIILIQVGTIPFLVIKHYAVIVFVCTVHETCVKQARYQNKQNEECTKKHLYLIVFFEQETRHGDGDVVAAWAIWVSILLEVLSCSVISEDLKRRLEIKE